MADIESLTSVPPETLIGPGRYGFADGDPGVHARRLDALALATLVAGRHQEEALSAAIKAVFGCALPQGAKATPGDCSFVGVGPGRWLAVVVEGDGETLERKLAGTIGKSGSVCDQSDGFVVFELTGPRLRDALAKLLTIDIDPHVFGPGIAATTSAALIGVTFWQLDDAPRFRFSVARSYGNAFIRALAFSSAEYGFTLERETLSSA
ncbi:MAG: sarcosine oxidase subunit gamma family protein [Rhizomicrobium sp.]